MASNEIPRDGAGGVLAGLLAPLRLPERVVEAIEAVAEKLEDVRPMREEVAAIREQSADLAALLPALDSIKLELGGKLDSLQAVIERLEGVESHLDERVGDLCNEIHAMHATMAGLKADVRRVTDRAPNPEARGPLGKARDVLTGD